MDVKVGNISVPVKKYYRMGFKWEVIKEFELDPTTFILPDDSDNHLCDKGSELLKLRGDQTNGEK